MFEIGVINKFKASHYLKGNFGPASHLHSHTYKVEVTIKGDALDEDGTLYDISKVKESLREVLSHLHCHNLNELKEFKDRNPTAENVCQYIYRGLASILSEDRIQGMEVKIWESPSAFASYYENSSR